MKKIINLSIEERSQLIETHKKEHISRRADRIKAILLLDTKKSFEEVADILLLSTQTIKNYAKEYFQDSDDFYIDSYTGGSSKLNKDKEEKLKDHLSKNSYGTAKEIKFYVKEVFGIEYTVQGLVHTLHRLGFTYKKTKIIPGKADVEKQEKFINEYKILKSKINSLYKIYFIDAVHPQHNSMSAYAWILKGIEKELATNTGRSRVNINGALDAETHEIIVREDPTINADSTIALFQEIENRNPDIKKIIVIADNARYNRSKKIYEYLENSKIEIKFLPPYAPNLNLIERVWKFFHKKVQYNKYYEQYSEFKTACLDFFNNFHLYKDELKTLLTDNFQIIGKQFTKT